MKKCLIVILFLSAVFLNHVYSKTKKGDNLKWLIKPKYDDASNFENGFAEVELNNKYGFIDENGKEICEMKYDKAFNFKNGFAEVQLNGKIIKIDTEGNEYDID